MKKKRENPSGFGRVSGLNISKTNGLAYPYQSLGGVYM